MTSIVVAAHNESAVIGRCLDALLAEAGPGEFDVTVVANGCTDDTAAIAAARPEVRVIELAEAGKTAALNAGDEAAQGFPRIYLDADIVLTTRGVRAVAAALEGPHLAATVRRDLDLIGRPVLVRAYFGVHRHLPVFRDGLFGRGVIGLSEAGRRRFDRFPALVADDLFLDSLFAAAEKRQVDTVGSRVATPRRTRDLVRRLSRVRGGNSAMRAAADRGRVAAAVRPAARLSWLRHVVLPRPWLAPAAFCYVAITALAALSARHNRNGAAGWSRDDSSRQEDRHASAER
ncbi:glycosyltransferase [Micromonospora sp. SL4-19]|uniref:glycosyltransferase n=1 Tax=Micromonospora sp. SL4-19 TaxID=3399129 RepID=UPI003A4DD506